MLKRLVVIFLIVIAGIITTSCNKNKSVIIFNHYPITEKTIFNNATAFKSGQRIYYIYLTKRDLKTEDIRVKIFTRNADARYAMGSMVYSNDFRLQPGEINYFTDYIVIHQPGHYVMMVYKKDYLWKPDATADFRVDEN